MKFRLKTILFLLFLIGNLASKEGAQAHFKHFAMSIGNSVCQLVLNLNARADEKN